MTRPQVVCISQIVLVLYVRKHCSFYYHSMHYGAEARLAIACRLSVNNVATLWIVIT